ncbi:MAG: hypothetical protein NTW06_02805 [Candidatus Falkowbacteria bacterium]|nr:hypothetical protein [Candidatus Falkowbacteria bacterium]
MLSYLDKFNNLAPELRDSISSPTVLAAIEAIENKYGVSLASVVMRVMVKEISMVDLPKYFVFEFGLDGQAANALVEDLKQSVFLSVADYLGFAVAEAAVAADQEKHEAWAKNEKKEADVSGSSFFFSPEDEEEVRELAKKVETFAPSKEKITQADDDNERKIDQICHELKVSFSSEELNSRFRKILSTYIKSVRNKIDTKQTLVKAIDAGGLSMDSIYVDNILLVTDRINEAFIGSQPRTSVKSSQAADPLAGNLRDVGYDFSQLAKKSAAVKAEEKPEPKAAEALHLTDETITEPPVKEQAIEEPTRREEDVIDLTGQEEPEQTAVNGAGEGLPADQPAPAAEQRIEEEITTPMNMANARQEAAGSERAKLEDVKYKPKLTGPVDELNELDLVNFRRLNADPEVAADKVKQKIKNLEKESYAKRLAGIKSWRQSPVNQRYLALGQASILNRKNIDDIIAEKKGSGEECLTAEEFFAIMNLNKELKY